MKNPTAIEHIEVVPRKGLLKDSLDKEGLKELLSQIDPEYRLEFERDLRAFMERENELIQEGHKGKYALFYENKCWKIGDDNINLIKLFEIQVGNYACYCDRIGGDI